MPIMLMDKEMKKLIVQLVSGNDADHLSTLKSVKRCLNTKPVEDQDVSCLLNRLISDVLCDNEEIVTEVLSILNAIIDPNSDLCGKVSVDQQNSLLENLLEILSKSKQPNMLKKCMLLLKNQHFNVSVVELFIESILTATSLPQLLENDTIEVINRLIEQCPKEMEENVLLWAKTMIQLSAHSNVVTRQMAVTALKENMSVLIKHRKTILPDCTTVLKQDVFPKLKQFGAKDDVLQEILSVLLPAYMSVVGEYFKKSSSLLNLLLQFVEKGFRHPKDEIRCCAFTAWGCFIDSFATNKELLASPKYVKLLTQPLKLKLKSPGLIKVRLRTLWKLVVSLEEKLLDLFEVVCKPLIQMCVSSEQTQVNPRRSSGRLSQDLMSHHPAPDKELQDLGIEMLAHLLLDVSKSEHEFALTPLYCPVMSSPSNFLRFQSFLVSCICDAICLSGQNIPDEFLSGFWNVMVKVAQECIKRKRDSDFFRTLFQSANQIVTTSNLKPESLLNLVCSISKFPQKVLNSSHLYSSDKKHSGMMHGTVNLALLDLLVTPSITKQCIGQTEFFECGQSIILCGIERQMAILEFVQAVVRHLSCDHPVYLELWCVLAEQIIEYIKKTKNVNQGDSLDHDFTALYDLISFPILFITKLKCDFNDMSQKAIDLWQSLAEKFFTLTLTVETAAPQEATTLIASSFLGQLIDNFNIVLDQCKCKFYQAFAVSLVKNAVFLAKPTENKRRSILDSLPNMDFNNVIVKLLFQLGVLELSVDMETLIINIMPALQSLFASAPPEQVHDFFVSFAPMFPTMLQQDSEMMKQHQGDVEECWRQVTLRLPYTSKLLEDDCTLDVFNTAFQYSTPSVYRSTVEFWELKVLESFDDSSVSSEFLSVLTSVYKKNGFKPTWDGHTEKENVTFNVSASSLQSSFDEDDLKDERENDDHVVEESVVDVTSESHPDAQCEVTNDSFDVTQMSGEELETSHSSLERSPEESNKSLNLRKLASHSTAAVVTSPKRKSTTSVRRRSARLQNLSPKKKKGNSKLPVTKTKAVSKKDSKSHVVNHDHNVSDDDEVVVLDDSDVSQNEHFVSACDVTNTDLEEEEEGDVTGEMDDDKSLYEVVDVAEMSVNQTGVHEDKEGSTSMESDDTEIDKSEIDESVYEVVEMTDVSMNSNKDRSDSTSDEATTDVEKSVNEYIDVGDTSLNSDPDKASPEQPYANESVYEVVDMVEMSINQTCPHDDSSLTSDDNEEGAVEKSIYEEGEVAEISVHPEPPHLEESKINESSTDDDQQDEVFAPNPDASVYEEVQMAEMSINTTTVHDALEEDKDHADENDAKNQEEISDEEMKEVEQELGVQPLDNSFDGDQDENSPETPETGQKEVPEKTVEIRPPSRVLRATAVATPDASDFAQPAKRKSDIARPDTPLRRSLRKRVSTPKVVSTVKDPPPKVRKTRQRLLPEEDAKDKKASSVSSPEITTPTDNEVMFDRVPVVVVTREQENNENDTKIVAESPQEQIPGDSNAEKALAETPMPTGEQTTANDKSNEQTPTEQQTIVAETPMVDLESKLTEKATEGQATETPSANECSSPTTTGQSTELVSTPKSCIPNRLATLREEAALTPSGSSPGGILKRRISEVPSPANKSRRVSFAEPISVSKTQEEMIPLSPNSSPHSEWRKNKFSSRIVNRRLSLPAPKRTIITPRMEEQTRSPMSVRSATVAAAIAGIKARGGDQGTSLQTSPTSNLQASSRDAVSPSKSIARVNQLTVSQLSNQSLLQNLSVSQLSHLTDSVLQAAPVIHAILMQKISKG
uniref:Telomere-associated protein RIF1-like n=1 Tax=Phallusia mammillata TaxID=59560 RepID=A0A6F9DQX3_9ASCI|nr:telomere-associated protein RIF1-like [Phallusia mammillata]